MNRRALLILAALVLCTAYGGRLAWRAYKDIVTLEAHDIALRDVVRSLKWQTWESIEVNKDVDGRINLTVTDQPLAVVLDLIAEQVGARWATAYPLYSTRAKLAVVRKVADGTLPQPQTGWTNWNARPNFSAFAARILAATNESGVATNLPALGPFGGGPGGFADGAPDFKPVTVDWQAASPMDAAQELRLFGRVKVVPEDGTSLRVNLSLHGVPMDTAVARLARAANRKWTKFYALEPQRRQGGGERPQMAQGEDREAMRARFEQMAQDPAFQARRDQRENRSLLNSTPSQRVERDQRRLRGRGGGGGGGGRGGPR